MSYHGSSEKKGICWVSWENYKWIWRIINDKEALSTIYGDITTNLWNEEQIRSNSKKSLWLRDIMKIERNLLHNEDMVARFMILVKWKLGNERFIPFWKGN